jgi:tRNA1Val (adenine37-N6)-methyltransferase
LMIDLLPDERIDDLQCKGHQIIQNPNMFCFGMDAVLLANFVKHRRDGMYMDLGTGTGVIPILLAAKEPSAPANLSVWRFRMPVQRWLEEVSD